jgi:hypothetical protein
MENIEFTEEDWAAEMNKRINCGRHKEIYAGCCNIPCPYCRVIGFYEPRGRKEEGFPRKYRACKFCGFWQEAAGKTYDEHGGDWYRCKMYKCEKCDTGSEKYNCYNWREPWEEGSFHCPKCGNTMNECSWPIDDLNHIFYELKNKLDNYHQQV